MICSLDKFPPLPPFGQLTLCEVEGKVNSMPAEYSNVESFTTAVVNHPKVSITRELLHHTPASRDEIGRIFVPVTDPFFKRVISTWYERGFMDAIQTAAAMQEGEGPRTALIFAQCVVKVANFIGRLKNTFHPHLRESGSRLISAVSQTRHWTQSPARCIEWHPQSCKLAVAAWDDSVRIYSDSPLTPVLKCKNMAGVSCLAWRPLSSAELAVGCETGAYIWSIDPTSLIARPSITTATPLTLANHAPVTSLSWSPSGCLLATASAADTALVLWEVDKGVGVPLRRVGGGGVCLVCWSPDGSRVFSATAGIVFRVWQTEKWIPDRWTTMSGRVHSACWSPCGSILLFATTDEPFVYCLPFALDTAFMEDTPVTARPVVDLTPVAVGGERVGGVVCAMAWDPRGRHLALVFKDCGVVAVFRTDLGCGLKVLPCCYINGLTGEMPSIISFQKNFDEGCVLTIAWSTGRLQHFPFVYTDLDLDSSRHSVLNGPRANFQSPSRSIFLDRSFSR